MKATGAAKSTVQQSTNRSKIADEFLAYIAANEPELSKEWGTVFADAPEKVLTQQEFWAHLATYVADVHVGPEGGRAAGEKLAVNTAYGHWGGIVNIARVRFSRSPVQDTIVRTRACARILCMHLALHNVRILHGLSAHPAQIPLFLLPISRGAALLPRSQ